MTIHDFLIDCGWQSGAGPDYYLPANGYPHVHLGLFNRNGGDIGTTTTYANKLAAYCKSKHHISFLAISKGDGRATPLVFDRQPTPHLNKVVQILEALHIPPIGTSE